MSSRPRLQTRMPSPAMAVALTALVVSLGGSAFAAGVVITKSRQLGRNVVTGRAIHKNAVTGAKVNNHSLTGADLNLAKLGKVPSAARADTAAQAGHADAASAADNAANASNAGHADAATHATTSDSAAALTPHEPWHEVGTPGEPQFENDWVNRDPGNGKESVGFFKDHEGIVHLKGAADGPDSFHTIFVLPPGYRPVNGREWVTTVVCGCIVADNDTAPNNAVPTGIGELTIAIDGRVLLSTAHYQVASTSISLDGVTFPTS